MRHTRREFIRQAGAAVAAASLVGRVRAEDDEMRGHRCDWMVEEGPFGMMVHWIAPGPAPEEGEWIQDLDKAVDAFQLERFLEQFEASGAAWLIFTIGQNSTYYASPNATLDRLCGPGHCSTRDLVLELAEGVHRLGKRFLPYLPAEVSAPTALHEGFAWNPTDQTEFQHRYTDFIREYALRLGESYDGWWFDGCYTWPQFHNSLYDWPLWCGAARAGNPDAALAFNDGSFCVGIDKPLTPMQDYLSGEVELLVGGRVRFGREETSPLILPEARFIEGTACQWHALLPIDCFWGHGTPGPMEPPKYSDDDLFSLLDACRKVDAVATLNVGIYQEGHLGTETVAQLTRLTERLG